MIGFDFEVFKYEWLVVFKNFFNGEYTVIHNDKEKLKEYVENADLLIGYNNTRYDNYILKSILLDVNPQFISKKIMRNEQLWKFAKWNDIQIHTYDVSYGLGYTSLKENEAYLGTAIDETPVDFDLDRVLTRKEYDMVVEYCKRDVDATELLFHKTKETFHAKLLLLKEFNLGRGYLSKSNPKLIEKILSANLPVPSGDENKGFDFSQLDIDIPKPIQMYFEQTAEKRNGFVYYLNGVEHIFGDGGIHGARQNFKYIGELWLIDVISYYPNMIIEYDWFSRAVSDKELYKRMLEERKVYKKTNKPLSDAYKLVLNSTYGTFNYPYCRMYDPYMANNITTGGQCMLVDLILKLENYCTLVQSNTDGIIIIPGDKDKIKEIIAEWEQRTRMKMEIVKGRKIIQKDVNNYVFEHEYGVDLAGGYVRQYQPRGLRKTLAVVDKAIVNNMLTGVSIREYILNNNDLIDYQIISKVGKTYDNVWFNGKKVNFVNRTFAGYDYGRLYKQKKGGNLEKVANQPDNSFLWNTDVNDLSIDKINKEWYIEIAEKRLSDYNGGK